MQAVTLNIKQKLSDHVLAAVGVFFTFGVILGFCVPHGSPSRANIPGLREGFFVASSTSKLFDAPSDLRLRGEKVLVVHRDEKDATPCKGDHAPLLFSANERVSLLSGSLSDLESLLSSINEEDLKSLDLIDPKDQSMSPCRSRLRVVYGDGESNP